MMKLANILYLANSGEIFGGGQISLLGLLERLDKKRFKPLVVCPSKGSLVDTLRSTSVETKIIRMETLRRLNIFSWINTVQNLTRLIRERKINLIHSNGSRATIYGGIAAKLTRTPLIWHVRIADRDRLLDKFLSKLATKIIVISKAVGKRFDWLKDKEDKVTVIYNGVDLEEFHPSLNREEARKEFRLLSSTPLVGIVGQLIPWKGHRYFLEAAAQVTKENPQAKFLIVGEDVVKKGGYGRELEEMAQGLGLRGKVIFAGFRKDIPKIMAALDIFILSSLKEHFGRVVIEAMACSKPVIATNAGGIPEIIRDGRTGILVPPKNSMAMAEATRTLLKDKKKARRMGLAGRKRVEKVFNIEENVRKTEEVYLNLLKDRRKGR